MNTKSFLHWLIGFLALNVVARLFFAISMGEAVSLNSALWLRGLVSDIAMATLLALLAAILAHLHRFFAWTVFLFWTVALASNREYISEWQANLSVFDIAGLAEPEFIQGSVLTSRLMVALSLLFIAGYLAFESARRCITYTLTGKEIFIAAALALTVFLIPASPPQLWMQQNLLEENIQQIADTISPSSSVPTTQTTIEARRFMAEMRRQDLEGERIVPPMTGANIIVLNVESLSENILNLGWMPFLQKLADENLHYSQYINPNITTIRGLYAQFCGEETNWARFGRDHMVQRIQNAPIDCLPKLLHKAGYQTAYLQGADLGFQNKKHIIPLMDFGEVLGNEEMKEGKRFSDWGLDDNSLFSNARQKIETWEAQRPGSPWMIGMLTVGTHHPYNVDPSFYPELGLRERAYRYTDDSIRALLEWLKETGRLDKTVVAITGDESRESRKAKTGLGRIITRNQGLMVIVTPDKGHQKVDTVYLQSDLPLSLLDYVGILPPPKLGGRSLFRAYSKFRPIAFADYSQNYLYAMWEPDELTACRTDRWHCKNYDLNNKKLFDPTQPFLSRPAEKAPMRALFEENKRYWFRFKNG